MAEIHDRPPEQLTLRLPRYSPESADAPYWDEHTVELEPHRSVLEGILQARDKFDGSIGIRSAVADAHTAASSTAPAASAPWSGRASGAKPAEPEGLLRARSG